VNTEKKSLFPENTFKGYDLTEEQVLSYLASASSIKEAARMANMTYGTLKKYAEKYTDPVTGKTLFDKFKNPSGKGVNRNYDKLVVLKSPEKIFTVGRHATADKIAKLKEIVIVKKIVPLLCNKCGYHERRLTDMKPPLLINFKNRNKSDWRIENIELLCYNCYFLYVSDPIKKEVVKKIESYEFDNEMYKDEMQNFHQMDDVYVAHLKSLGLDGEGDVPDNSNTNPEDLLDYGDEGDDLVDLL
jgi:hypothetical protein